jgi:hypothetical protein
MDKTPPWRAERRGILGNQGAHTRKLERRLARHTLDWFEGQGKRGVPGAFTKNTGDETRLLAFFTLP